MRLIFLGDSLTEGSYGGDFVAEVARRLPDHEVINAGVSGNTIINLCRRLDDVIDREPDGVFVMVGGNDAISYSQPKTRAYYTKAQGIDDGVVTPDDFASAYRDLLSRLQIAHIQTWVGLPPAEYNPATVEAMERYNAIAAEIARSMAVPVLDLMAHFKPDDIPERPPIDVSGIVLIGQRASSGWNDYDAERDKHGYTYSFDGLHITPGTARAIADLIVETISS